MSYPKLSWIRLRNYGSYVDETIKIDKNILKIEGMNNAGKSAILHGLESVFTNESPRAQASMVRNGATSSIVDAGFEDGVVIEHEKYKDGPEIFTISKNDDIIFTTKEGDALTAVQGIPKPIADYLGLVVTQSTVLNYRSDDDPLLFVNTKKADNYSVFNEVMRTEDLVQAGVDLNDDINSLTDYTKQEVAERESLKNQIFDYAGYSDKLSETLSNMASEMKSMEDRVTVTKQLASAVPGLESGRVQDTLKTPLKQLSDELAGAVSGLTQVSRLTSFLDAFLSLEDEYKVKDTITSFDKNCVDSVNSLKSLIKINNLLNSLPNVGVSLDVLNSVSHDFNEKSQTMSKMVSMLSSIGKLSSSIENLSAMKQNLNSLEAQKDLCLENYKKSAKILEESGYKVGTCPNCHSPVVVGGPNE